MTPHQAQVVTFCAIAAVSLLTGFAIGRWHRADRTIVRELPSMYQLRAWKRERNRLGRWA